MKKKKKNDVNIAENRRVYLSFHLTRLCLDRQLRCSTPPTTKPQTIEQIDEMDGWMDGWMGAQFGFLSIVGAQFDSVSIVDDAREDRFCLCLCPLFPQAVLPQLIVVPLVHTLSSSNLSRVVSSMWD